MIFDITESRQINAPMCTIATKWLSEMVVEKQSNSASQSQAYFAVIELSNFVRRDYSRRLPIRSPQLVGTVPIGLQNSCMEDLKSKLYLHLA